MLNAEQPSPQEPLRVSILTQGSYLIASIHTALDDSQLVASVTTCSSSSVETGPVA